MSRSDVPMRKLARRLIAHAARENTSSGSQAPGAFPVCDQLRPYLATLMGNGGFHALLSRALALAQLEAPSLRAVQVHANGSLAGFPEHASKVEVRALAEGKEILLAQLLALLATFIGASLTLQMLRQLWPKLSLNDLDLG